ncbi:MAG: hypothetical protein QXT65_04510 [Candidatus Nitrosocaldaceae archaeon]
MDTLLWIGENKNPVKYDRSHDYVMDSVINYYNNKNIKLSYKPLKLFLDNGAFTASTHNKALNKDRVVYIQEQLNPDKTIPLDYPFSRYIHTLKEMIDSWNKTQENILYWQSSTRLNGKLVPSLHAWNKESLKNNIKWLQSKADAEYIAIGSIIHDNTFISSKHLFGDRHFNRTLLEMINISVKYIHQLTDFKVHMMGIGSSPLTLHLAYYLGISSIDSAGYRRKAAYGKIILQGTGERYVGNMQATFGRVKGDLRAEDMEKLLQCKCSVCSVDFKNLWKDFKARAIHNEYTIKMESQIAKEYLESGLDKYEKYLDNIFARSSFNYLWKYAKMLKHNTTL